MTDSAKELLLSANGSTEMTGVEHVHWNTGGEHYGTDGIVIDNFFPEFHDSPSTTQADEDINVSPDYPGFVTTGMNFLYNFTNTNTQAHQMSSSDLLNELSSTSTPLSFTLEYVHFATKFFKVQRRPNRQSEQRIEDGNVSIVLDFKKNDFRSSVTGISIKVKRTNETDNITKRVGEVPVPAQLSNIQDTKTLVKLDLDSVYTYNGKKVYELERSSIEELNIFHLIFEVRFATGQIVSQNTRPFQLIGKKPPPKAKTIKAGEKRAHADSTSSTGSVESLTAMNNTHPSNSHSPSSSATTLPYSNNAGLIHARKVVADHIKTKTLEIDNIFMGKTIQTHQGDIAYHFLLEDDKESFEEGEIVGFIPDDKDNKKQVIKKLNYKNASDAVLKGVVTRSQYLEAQKPESGVCSETICMMGIVPVQVKGSVCANEALYASPYHPGLAISGHHLDISDLHEAAFIGYAFSSRKTDDENSIGMVQAGVSILQTASKYMLDLRLRSLEVDVDFKIDKIQKSRKRSRKCVIIFGVISFILVVLIATFLWQLLVPGSAYRYYVCKLGRKTNPEGKAFYHFIPYSNIFAYPRVNGIEFTFEKLMKKTHHTDYHAINGTGYRYYLNIDRCAYGSLRNSKDTTLGHKRVYGADVFAFDYKCYNAWYYNEEPPGRWKKYNSVSWVNKTNIYCMPRSKYKNLTKHEEW